MMKCVDTTVLLAAVDSSSPLHRRATELFEQMSAGEWISCVCHSSLSEFVEIVTSSKHCARPLSVSAVQKAMDKMLARHRPMVLYSDDTILRRAMKLMEKYPSQKERFTETHIAATAITHGVKTIVTADSSGFQAIRELDVENPFEALFA